MVVAAVELVGDAVEEVEALGEHQHDLGIRSARALVLLVKAGQEPRGRPQRGFDSVEVVKECPPIAFPSLGDFWEWRVSFPATHLALAKATPYRYAALRASCIKALAPLVTDGSVRADQAVLFAVARP